MNIVRKGIAFSPQGISRMNELVAALELRGQAELVESLILGIDTEEARRIVARGREQRLDEADRLRILRKQAKSALEGLDAGQLQRVLAVASGQNGEAPKITSGG